MSVLRKTGVTSAPIPVHLVAQRLGLVLEAASFGDDVSGVLVIDGDRAVIGYNSSHSPTRQRFSIAHEIGHYTLHRADSTLFIDQRYFAAFRDRGSASGADKRERQANAFAAALLMPSELVLREVEHRHFDLGDEDGLRGLAEAFQVSVQAMVYRLTNMGVLSVPPEPDEVAADQPPDKARRRETTSTRIRR
jgi:Zn-dependent peptidase ImmA (M78 family)